MERIKIFTRSFDLRLYLNSRGLYEMLGFPIVRLTDQTADGYFYTMLADTDCDIAINIDEDAFLVDPDAMMSVVNAVIDGGYANAGAPDGGYGARGANPIVTNPFFNVLNLKLIRSKFSKSYIKAFDYASHKQEMIEAFPKEKLGYGGYDFDLNVQEPYYQFFFWIAYNFKTLYLTAQNHPDGITTILLTLDGRVICKHSWFARFYAAPDWAIRFFQRNLKNQKARIDALIDECYAERGMQRPVFGLKDHLSFIANKIIRWVIKVPQRISRWPHKLHLKLSKQK